MRNEKEEVEHDEEPQRPWRTQVDDVLKSQPNQAEELKKYVEAPKEPKHKPSANSYNTSRRSTSVSPNWRNRCASWSRRAPRVRPNY